MTESRHQKWIDGVPYWEVTFDKKVQGRLSDGREGFWEMVVWEPLGIIGYGTTVEEAREECRKSYDKRRPEVGVKETTDLRNSLWKTYRPADDEDAPASMFKVGHRFLDALDIHHLMLLSVKLKAGFGVNISGEEENVILDLTIRLTQGQLNKLLGIENNESDRPTTVSK